jgi:tetratricopeptide (TPR) repeat protein
MENSMFFRGLQLRKNTRYGVLFCAILLLLTAATMPARAGDAVPVKMGTHADYTRIVFEFPRLVAYHAVKVAKGIEITFDTPLSTVGPTKQPSAIQSFLVSKPDSASLKVLIGLKPGSDFKHYRLMRKIVLDISPPNTKDAPEKQVEKKPVENPVAATPLPQKETAPEKTATATPPPPAEAPAPKAAPVAPVTAEIVPAVEDEEANATKIVLSTVSLTRIAVFQRFSMLWILADGQVSNAFAPIISGPLSGFLGKPKIFKFGEGRAWRYPMPEGSFVNVQKKGLTWSILLLPKQPKKDPSVTVNVDIDHTSRKAKLMTQLPGAGDVITFEDPSAGDTLYVVATDQENARVSVTRHFSDVDILAADMGMVVRPLKDSVRANKLGDYLLITSPQGILATADVIAGVSSNELDDTKENHDEAPLFNFPEWRGGGIKNLYKDKREMMQKISEAKTPEERESRLMELAWLYFANNLGPETLGALGIIEAENEDVSNTPDFIALKGAANALTGHYQDALQYLSNPLIQQHPEVNLWIGYAAAATEQWHKANQAFPKSNRLLIKYPDNIAIPFTLYMAESALRLGHTDTASALLASVSTTSQDFSLQYQSAIGYLKGEAFRQQGDSDGAIREWQPVAQGIDRLYHTKASLALANLLLEQKKISLKEAIDKIDSLRFAWRGDGLEVQILYNLGELKVKNGQYLSGLEDMKFAITLSDTLMDDATPIRDSMSRTFSDLYIGGAAEKIPPLEAISVYNEFTELMPPGQESAAANVHFADYLIRMDLLSKAEKILDTNLKSGNIPDDKIAALGTKLAAIYLLDSKPDAAIATLDGSVRGGTGDKEERTLLRARAQSMLRQPDEAIHTLSESTSADARKLRVDILWHAQKWEEAATALEALAPASSAKLDTDEAQIVLNMAVATKLAGDIKKLEEIKTRYTSTMAITPLASTFGVVTRETGVSALSDRDTILKMAGEVDMFKGFLANYKANVGKGG